MLPRRSWDSPMRMVCRLRVDIHLLNDRISERDFALHEYTEAQVNSIFLNMYTWASNKLFQDIQTGDEELAAVSARCDIDSPPVIQEYLAASDEDKQLFEMTFKSFKTNTHLKAKEMWYDWMWQLLETIKPDVQTVLTGMKEVGPKFVQRRGASHESAGQETFNGV